MHRVLLFVAMTVSAVVALSGSPSTAETESTSTSVRYVALGDSYTSGPGILPQTPNPPAGCFITSSEVNYPHLVANALGLTGDAFVDASCSGADTDEVQQKQVPQLSHDTTLVTITVSGDNNGIFSSVGTCETDTPDVPKCDQSWLDNTFIPAVDAAAPDVGELLDAIHAAAPAAKVFLVNYLAIQPASGTGCYPAGPDQPGNPYAYADIPFLRQAEVVLNTMLAQQAAAHRATLVDVYTPSIPHDSCEAPEVRWVEPMRGFLTFPLHPNAAGHQAMAAAVLAAFEASEACPTSDTTSTGTADPPVASHGYVVTFSGNGFAPEAHVELVVCSTSLSLGSATADANGELRAEVVVPSAAQVGEHRLIGLGLDPAGRVHASVAALQIAARAEPTFTG